MEEARVVLNMAHHGDRSLFRYFRHLTVLDFICNELCL
jgi:hypothetical protein